MNSMNFNLRETGYFSPLFLDYVEDKPQLKDFYSLKPGLNQFKDRIGNRQLSEDVRKTLTNTLFEQYDSTELYPAVKDNITQLSEQHTFTVTTGHQLNIFSGPMYFHYKILTVLNLARELKNQYPNFHFVPVYWMASEDHDFEEINHFNLFGKKYTWETGQKGPVGRYDPKSIGSVLEQLPENPELFAKAYLEHETLADATRYFVNELYGRRGLVVLDADHPLLKKQFKAIIKDDLLNHNANKAAENTTEKLRALGYKPQIYPRKINIFYLEDHFRDRIEKINDIYVVKSKGLSFTEFEMMKLLDQHPEKFSPNVLLRPVYQEKILPNLAYIGGPAEISYWLQLKEVFMHYGVDFPMLIPRNFALILEKPVKKRLKKLGLSPEALFLGEKAIKRIYLEKHSSVSFDISDEKKLVLDSFLSIKSKTKIIDPSLEGYIGAEMAKAIKSLDHVEKRLRKAAEKKEETGLRQLDQLLERIFPNGSLQERTINFLNFWLNDPDFLDKIQDAMKPFDFDFHILADDE